MELEDLNTGTSDNITSWLTDKAVDILLQHEVEKIVNDDRVEISFVTGSSVVCTPPVTDTDIDIVLHVNVVNLPEFVNQLQWEDWEMCGEDYGDITFNALRKGKYNLLVISDINLVHRWFQYTRVASLLNLKEKFQRETLASGIIDFNVLIYEDYYSDVKVFQKSHGMYPEFHKGQLGGNFTTKFVHLFKGADNFIRKEV